MNKNIKKILIIFIVFLYCFFPLKTFSEIKTDVDHLIVQDFHSGKILFERDADMNITLLIKNTRLASQYYFARVSLLSR